MQIGIVIPARYASSRFPGKPLVDLHGKPMIQHVYERARASREASWIVVATDDARIAAVVEGFGGEVVMTSPDHPSGTDRMVEVAGLRAADAYVNVQGDEPLIRAADIDKVAAALRTGVEVATLCHPISAAEAENPHVVKVVMGHDGRALYFSRAKIPFEREPSPSSVYWKHIGLYGFQAATLRRYPTLAPSPLEAIERLEQLRLLQAGIAITVIPTEPTGPGVDTPACLEAVHRLLAGGQPAPGGPCAGIALLLLDVDGVLTDGQLQYTAEGETIKAFHVHDGLGIGLLQAHGVRVGVVSGREGDALARRLRDLDVRLVAVGAADKRAACEALIAEAGVSPRETAFVGDDLPDLAAFELCGRSFAVANATPCVKARATAVLTRRGGDGAVREVAELILRDKGLGDVLGRA